MTEESTGLPRTWLSRNFGIDYICDEVPMFPPYTELRDQNSILGAMYRLQALMAIPRFQLMQRAGKVCYEVAGIVVEYFSSLEPDYVCRSLTIVFDHPIKGGISQRGGGQIANNHAGQIVASIMKPGNPYVGIVDMASYLFGWNAPIIASGHRDHIHEILSYLYSLHQPDPVTVEKLQIAEA